MKRQVEIFTAGCPVCDPTIQLVIELASDNCEVSVYDITKLSDDKPFMDKVEEYGIKQIPAVAIDGILLDCCKESVITKDRLLTAGVGQA